MKRFGFASGDFFSISASAAASHKAEYRFLGIPAPKMRTEPRSLSPIVEVGGSACPPPPAFRSGGVGFPTQGTQGVACNQRGECCGSGGCWPGWTTTPAASSSIRARVGFAPVHRDVTSRRCGCWAVQKGVDVTGSWRKEPSTATVASWVGEIGCNTPVVYVAVYQTTRAWPSTCLAIGGHQVIGRHALRH